MPADHIAWRTLSELGEKLLALPTLHQQHQFLLQTVQTLLAGQATIWLDAAIFNLPGAPNAQPCSPQPTSDLLQQAVSARRLLRLCPGNDGRYWLATPLMHQDTILGGIQIVRDQSYQEEEVELLSGLANIAALALTTAHRFAMERWRLEQLQLVRQVALQVANVLDVDELADRVATLIQKTFGYYYVAIFTLEPEAKHLRFRSNAARRGQVASPIESVALGQGLIGLAASSGNEIIVPDVTTDPRYRYLDSLPETRSEVALPLKIEQRLLGVLDVQSDRPDAFHPNDLLVLRALSDNIARAIDAAQVHTTLRKRAEQLSVVAEVSKRLTARLDLEELMQAAADLLHRHFGYPYVHLFTVHPHREEIIYRAGSGARSQALPQPTDYVIPLNQPRGLIPWVARHGETALLNDVHHDPRYRPSPLPPTETAAELCIPLIFADQVVGILDIQSDQPNAFGPDDRQLAEAIGDTLAVAIRNADLYRAERWRHQVAESLREVAILLSEDASLEQVLAAILQELQRSLPTEAAAIWLLDEEDNFYLAAAWGVEKSRVEAIRRQKPRAAARLLSVLLHDQPNIRQPEDPPGPLGLAAGFSSQYSAIATPLKLGEEPLGILALAHSARGRYGNEARALLTTFAGYAAVAIENARLYDRTQEQAYASAALLQVAQAVASLASLDEILQRVVRSLPILVGIERVALYSREEESQNWQPRQTYGLPRADRPHLQRPFSIGAFPLLDAACQRNAPVFCNLKPGQTPASWPQLPPLPPQANPATLETRQRQPLLMAFPLSIKNEVFGVMLVEESDNPLRFRARRVDILTGIAQQLGMAMQNDRLQAEMVFRERLQAEIELARQIQESFIPRHLPQITGLELAGDWRTARQVGGDFYDVLRLPSGLALFFIADVADKGMPAALFMALTRKLVHAAVLQSSSPAQILAMVNRMIYPDCHQGMFVTAFCAIYDPHTGRLTYANAGHNPPIYRSASGALTRLQRTGMALGVLEESRWQDTHLQLQPGDWLCLYTDGVTETFSADGQMFGEERLQAILQTPPDTATDLVQTIVAQALAFSSNREPQDDLTLLVLHKTGEAA